MRTKHLLYTMALASVFAACTQDEFVTEGGSINPLEGRKSLGKITLVEAESPSTRWTVDNWNTFNPEAGDGFSYLLVDEPRQGLDGQHEYPIDNYELVNHIHTNYVFKYNGTKWDSEANLVEGNYLLVGPAQDVQNRKPVEIKLPAKQNLALGEDGKVDPLSIIKEFNESGYPILIGHRFLSEGGDNNNALPKRYNIFAYPEITVKNSERNDELTPVVTKVILKRNSANNPFIINAPLDNVKAARLLTNESFKRATENDKNQIVVGEWEAYMNKTLGMGELTVDQDDKKEAENTQEIPANVTEEYDITMLQADGKKGLLKTYKYNNGLKGFTKNLLAGKPTSTSQYIVIEMPGNGVEVPRGTEFTFNAVIPADRYVMGTRGEDLEIFAVLSTGEVYKKIMKSNSTVEMYPGKRYPDQDYTGMEVKGVVGEYFTIDVNEGGSDGVSSYEKCDPSEIADLGSVNAVKTTEDLIAVIKNTSSTQKLNVTVEGSKVVYNEAVNNAVANTSCQIINILGHIKIEGSKDKALTISDKVSFEDAVIEKYTVVFDSETATLGTVLVGKDATFELKNAGMIDTNNDDTPDAYSAEIHNAGTLKLHCADFADVYNYETLEVYTDVSSASITNSKHACSDKQEIISAVVNLTPSVDLKVVDKGDGTYTTGQYEINETELDYPIVVEGLKKDDENSKAKLILGANVEIVKDGSIVNDGVIKSNGEKTLTVGNGLGETLTNGVNGVIESKVIIEGASHKLNELPVDAKLYKAAAQVTNNGTMMDAQIDGLLTMGADSRLEGTLTMTTGYNGEIDNTAKGTIVNDPSTMGIVVFANIPGMNLTSAEAIAATSADFKAYTATTRVTVARLTGAVVMGNNIAKDEIGFRSTEAGLITELEFAEGSSLTIGEGTFKTNLTVTVSYENIEWTGRTSDASKFTLNGKNNGKKKFVKFENNQAKAVDGNVVFKNCQKVSSLE